MVTYFDFFKDVDVRILRKHAENNDEEMDIGELFNHFLIRSILFKFPF